MKVFINDFVDEVAGFVLSANEAAKVLEKVTIFLEKKQVITVICQTVNTTYNIIAEQHAAAVADFDPFENSSNYTDALVLDERQQHYLIPAPDIDALIPVNKEGIKNKLTDQIKKTSSDKQARHCR